MNDAFCGEFRISIVAVGREPSGSLTPHGLRWAAKKLILTRRFNAQFCSAGSPSVVERVSVSVSHQAIRFKGSKFQA